MIISGKLRDDKCLYVYPNDRSFKHNQMQVFHIIYKEELMKSGTGSTMRRILCKFFLFILKLSAE